MKQILIKTKKIVSIIVNDEEPSERYIWKEKKVGMLWWKKTISGYYDNIHHTFVYANDIMDEALYKIDYKNKLVIIKSYITLCDSNNNKTVKRFESENERDAFIEQNFNNKEYTHIVWSLQ